MPHERRGKRNLKLGVEQQREDEGGGQLGELLGERRQARRAEEALQKSCVSRPRERPLATRGIAARVVDLRTNGDDGGLIRGDDLIRAGGNLVVHSCVVRRSAAEPRLDHQPPSPKLGSNRVRRRRRAHRAVQTTEAAHVSRVGAPAVIPRGVQRHGNLVVHSCVHRVHSCVYTRSKVKIGGWSVPSPRHRRRARRAHRSAVRDAQEPL